MVNFAVSATGSFGNAAGHVQADHQQALRANFAHSLFDLSAHQSTGEHERTGSGQPRNGADGVGDGLLSYQWDGVDRDMLAADIVAVGFGYGADRDLAHLGAATDDDDSFPEDLLKCLDDADIADDRRRQEVGTKAIGIARHIDFEVDAGFRGPLLDDLDIGDVAVMTRDNAGQLVQDSGARRCNYDDANSLRHGVN